MSCHKSKRSKNGLAATTTKNKEEKKEGNVIRHPTDKLVRLTTFRLL
jgi:hypothetical protein